MENRETICNYDQLVEAMSICQKIQNNGIATVFFDFSGHVNITYIKIHKPIWVSNVNPDYKFEMHHDEDEDGYYFKDNEATILKLTAILSGGKLSEDDEQEAMCKKEKEARRRQYEDLKKEFEPELISL